MTSRPELPRFDTIDVLRGLSILSVILLHASIFLQVAGLQVEGGFSRALTVIVFDNGGNGVSIFFAISGFLITFISIRRFGSLERMKPLRFYRIRFARIGPPLFLLLAILSVLDLANVHGFRIEPAQGTLPKALFAALTFQVNWYEAVHGWLPPAWTVLWSLSVEEMFYLFFPLLCLVLLRRKWSRPLFFAILAGFVVFGPSARRAATAANSIWGYQSYLGNVDNIALGCLAAILATWLGRFPKFTKMRWTHTFQCLGAALMLLITCEWPRVIFRQLPASQTVTVLGIGTCLVMLGSVLHNTRGTRWTAPVRWLGRQSYEIYLTHTFVLMLLLAAYKRTHLGPIAFWIGATVIASSAVGWALARWISEPANAALRGKPLRLEPQAVEHLGR